MRQLFDTPEFKSLRGETMGDEQASEMAAAQFAVGWAKIVATPPPTNEFEADMEALKAAFEACKAAAIEVGEFHAMTEALGGITGASKSRHSLTERFKKLRKNRRLRDIAYWPSVSSVGSIPAAKEDPAWAG